MTVKTYDCVVLNVWNAYHAPGAYVTVYSPNGDGYVTLNKVRLLAHWSKRPLMDASEFNTVHSVVHTPHRGTVALTVEQLRTLRDLATHCGSIKRSTVRK